VISGLYCRARQARLSLAIIFGLFLAANVALDLVWCWKATYTVRDQSREIGCRALPGEYFVDGWSWQLSMENRCRPIYSPWYYYGRNINVWFEQESERTSFLLSRTHQFDGYPIRQSLLAYDYHIEHASEMSELQLCPVIFGSQHYRYEGALYYVRPVGALRLEASPTSAGRHMGAGVPKSNLTTVRMRPSSLEKL
jgi:hypothetical protein